MLIAARSRRARAARRRRRHDDVAHGRAGDDRRRWCSGSTRCGSCCASRSLTSPPTGPSSASRPRDSASPGEPLAWVDPWPPIGAGSVAYGPVDDHPGAGWRHREVLVPRASSRAGPSTEPVGMWAFEALRVEAARPRLGFETDHRTIPHELDWLRTAVHLEKGCYRGQETVARVHNLGRPPRRLVLLHLDGSEASLPSPRRRRTPRRPRRRLRHDAGPPPRARADRARRREASDSRRRPYSMPAGSLRRRT